MEQRTMNSKTLRPSISNAMQMCPWWSNQSSIRTHRLHRHQHVQIIATTVTRQINVIK